MRVSIVLVGVPAPVGAGDRVELEGADRCGGGGVRAAAEVGERPVGVQRDGLQRVLVVGCADEVVDQLDLVVLALAARSARAPAVTGTSSRTNGSAAFTCSRMRSSIAGKSSSETVVPSGNSKS